jgi:hypothetical protein
LGYFREDYEYVSTSTATPDYLDEHNGRFCVTPEYPNGTYCYFATVDANWNSAYPYAVGPTFYGVKSAAKVTSITEPVTKYIPATTGIQQIGFTESAITVFPNPSNDIIAIQANDITQADVLVQLFDVTGKLLDQTYLRQGSTIAYFDVSKLYAGNYVIHLTEGTHVVTKKITLAK